MNKLLQTCHTHRQSSRSQAPHLTSSFSELFSTTVNVSCFYIVITLVIMRLVVALAIPIGLRCIHCPPKSGLRVRWVSTGLGQWGERFIRPQLIEALHATGSGGGGTFGTRGSGIGLAKNSSHYIQNRCKEAALIWGRGNIAEFHKTDVEVIVLFSPFMQIWLGLNQQKTAAMMLHLDKAFLHAHSLFQKWFHAKMLNVTGRK